jgi:hypothetical protein
MKVMKYIDELGRPVARVVPDETVITVPPELPSEPQDEPQDVAPILKKNKKGGKR